MARTLTALLDAAAAVIAALRHDHQALREHLDSCTGRLVDLEERRTQKEHQGPMTGPC